MAEYNYEVIINESNGRCYYKRITKSGTEFQGNMTGQVYLRESAYNIEEEQRLIELDENSRGQPPLKKIRLGNTSASNMSYQSLDSKNSFPVDGDENIVVNKCPKSNSSMVSKFYIKSKNRQSLSLESITDEDIVIPQRKCSASKSNQIKERSKGLSISEIFENEFAEEKSKFYSYIKGCDELSISSVRSEKKPERKQSVCNKLKKFALSGHNFLSLKKESDNFKKNSPVKTKDINENRLKETILENPPMDKVASSKQSKLVTEFLPEASIIQNGCVKIVSSVFHQVKGVVPKTEVSSNNKLLSKIDNQKADVKLTSSINKSTTVSNSNKTISVKQMTLNSNSKSTTRSNDTQNEDENYSSSASDEMEDSNVGSESGSNGTHETDEISNDEFNSAFEIPQRHYGQKEKIKRDKALIENLMNRFDKIHEEKSKKKSKLSIFQKLIRMFSRNKDSSPDSQKKEKSSFREIIRKGLGFKQSIKVKHNNSVVMYREKRRKLFHEQKEFFEDSVSAYSNARIPVLLRSDNGEIDSQLSSPIKRIIACTVSDGVFHERKRKLGQSRLGLKESIKNLGDGTKYSVNNERSSSDIRGILKNK